jgi:hypothetical protein
LDLRSWDRRDDLAKLVELAPRQLVFLDMLEQQGEVVLSVQALFPGIDALPANEFIEPTREHIGPTLSPLDHTKL